MKLPYVLVILNQWFMYCCSSSKCYPLLSQSLALSIPLSPLLLSDISFKHFNYGKSTLLKKAWVLAYILIYTIL